MYFAKGVMNKINNPPPINSTPSTEVRSRILFFTQFISFHSFHKYVGHFKQNEILFKKNRALLQP
jgi:hypothetical protein